MELKEDKNRIRLVVGWIVDIAVVISIAWFAVFAMGTQIRVSGQSMEPVLSQNEKVLMNRLSYRVMRPKRYDIIDTYALSLICIVQSFIEPSFILLFIKNKTAPLSFSAVLFVE